MKLFRNGLKKRYYECFIVYIQPFTSIILSVQIVCIFIFVQIASDLLDGKEIPHEIRWIADGPNSDVPTFSGYKVHGVPFSTKSRDDARQVQCSGVCVDAETMVVQATDRNINHTSHTYYGVTLQEIKSLPTDNLAIIIYQWLKVNFSY